MDIHVVKTGPIAGGITLADGTVVDVTPEYISVPSAEVAAEVAQLIGDHYAENGHPNVEGDFIHEPAPTEV